MTGIQYGGDVVRRPLAIAHRGAAARLPENTLAAFEAALAAGADGIECDTRLSADGVPVVIHDRTVKRTTGATGRVGSLTLERLRKLDAGGGERIPTLAETAELCRGRGLLYLEFKEAGAVAPALAILKSVDDGELIFCSFQPNAVRACKELRPRVPALLITGSRNPNPIVRWRESFPLRAIRKSGADGLSCHHGVVTPKRTERIRAAGLQLVIWCSLKEEKTPPVWFGRALQASPDALVTAWPEELLALLENPPAGSGAVSQRGS